MGKIIINADAVEPLKTMQDGATVLRNQKNHYVYKNDAGTEVDNTEDYPPADVATAPTSHYTQS
jgi:hypothetical protein